VLPTRLPRTRWIVGAPRQLTLLDQTDSIWGMIMPMPDGRGWGLALRNLLYEAEPMVTWQDASVSLVVWLQADADVPLPDASSPEEADKAWRVVRFTRKRTAMRYLEHVVGLWYDRARREARDIQVLVRALRATLAKVRASRQTVHP